MYYVFQRRLRLLTVRQQRAILEINSWAQWPQSTPEEVAALNAVFSNAAVSANLQQLRIPLNELLLHETLGSGGFGEVRLASWRGEEVAAKHLHRAKIRHKKALRQFLAAAELQLALGEHENVVRVLGFCWEAERAAVVQIMELCTLGPLSRHLHPSAPALSWETQKLPIAAGVARALAFLHSNAKPLIHCDLKPSNILLDHVFKPKLADFGLAREQQEHTMSAAGPKRRLKPVDACPPPTSARARRHPSFHAAPAYRATTRRCAKGLTATRSICSPRRHAPLRRSRAPPACTLRHLGRRVVVWLRARLYGACGCTVRGSPAEGHGLALQGGTLPRSSVNTT